MSYEPPLNDSVFYDDSDFIACNVCGEEFDHNLYNSRTCQECEDNQTTKEGESKK